MTAKQCCTIFNDNAVACYMQRASTRVNGYFQVTIPGYLSGASKNHFQRAREKSVIDTRNNANWADSNWLFLWSVASREPYSTIADRFGVNMSSAYKGIC